MPAALMRSGVSKLSPAPGPSQPRSFLPVNRSRRSAEFAITAASSSSNWRDFCIQPCPTNSQPAFRIASAALA